MVVQKIGSTLQRMDGGVYLYRFQTMEELEREHRVRRLSLSLEKAREKRLLKGKLKEKDGDSDRATEAEHSHRMWLHVLDPDFSRTSQPTCTWGQELKQS